MILSVSMLLKNLIKKIPKDKRNLKISVFQQIAVKSKIIFSLRLREARLMVKIL